MKLQRVVYPVAVGADRRRARYEVFYQSAAFPIQPHAQFASCRERIDVARPRRLAHGFDLTLFCAYIERTHLERRAVSEHACGKFDLYKRAGLGDSLPNIYRESVLAELCV